MFLLCTNLKSPLLVLTLNEFGINAYCIQRLVLASLEICHSLFSTKQAHQHVVNYHMGASNVPANSFWTRETTSILWLTSTFRIRNFDGLSSNHRHHNGYFIRKL